MAICEIEIEDLQDLVGRDLDGRYLLQEYITKGGFGAVYRGIDRKLNQPVAIKIGTSSREFMKEARLAAGVKHQNIVQVTDFGNDRGFAYLVMEFLDGDDLDALFAKQGRRLTSTQLRKLVDEVGGALAYAHDQHHLIHRDLKPRNIVLRREFQSKNPSLDLSKFVLLDFGIAAKLDAEGTQRNHTQDGAGTVEYMAPELLSRSPETTPLSDVYAFGVILYQMMTGRVPFPQSDTSHLALAECLTAICHEPVPGFSDVKPAHGYSEEMEELILSCLSKNPEERPQSMAEVCQRFRELDCSSNFVATAEESGYQPRETVRTPGATATRFPSKSARHVHRWESLAVSRFALSGQRHWAMLGGIVIATFLSIVGILCLVSGRSETAFDVLTYEHGHLHGKQVDSDSPLPLETGGNIRLTYLIESPQNDVVHFEQPDFPDELNIEIFNGPVPHKSKCFTISFKPGIELPDTLSPIVLSARSERSGKTFTKKLQIAAWPN